jgi:hypothetical protein
MENNTIDLSEIKEKKIKLSPADQIRIWKKNNVAKRTQQMQRRRYRQKVLQELMNILIDDIPQ